MVLNEELAPHIGKILALCPGLTSVLFSGGYDCAITGMKFERGQGDQAKYLTVQKVKLHGHQAPVSTLLTVSNDYLYRSYILFNQVTKVNDSFSEK